MQQVEQQHDSLFKQEVSKLDDQQYLKDKKREQEKREREQKFVHRIDVDLIQKAKEKLQRVEPSGMTEEQMEDQAYGRPTFARKKDRDRRVSKDKKDKG